MPERTQRATRRRVSKRGRSFVFTLTKLPTQARAQATFDAIVTAAARLLAARGYTDVTTNHIAAEAGVGIGSLYEYFPGKDAIVAQVAERMIDRVLHRIGSSIPEVLASPKDRMTRVFIDLIYETLLRERKLVAVFVEEVPYTRSLPQVRAITPRLFALSRAMQRHAGIALTHESASLHLMNNLVSSTLLQLVLDPPSDVAEEEMLAALSHRIGTWVQDDGAR